MRMSAVRQRDTTPERIVRSFLHRQGVRFALNRVDLPGKPDIVLPKHKTVMFVHGCFWHRHSKCKRATTPKTNQSFWLDKFKTNVARDKKVSDALKKAGWRVMIIWECEVEPHLTGKVVSRMRSLYKPSRGSENHGKLFPKANGEPTKCKEGLSHRMKRKPDETSGSGAEHMSAVDQREMRGDDHAFLRSKVPHYVKSTTGMKSLTSVDLFCGVGGLSLGVAEAALSLQFDVKVKLACDIDPTSLACFRSNFADAVTVEQDITRLLSDVFEAPLTPGERSLSRQVGETDILVGGPPCQGHSDLNNYSRRDDPKNSLYKYMARAARIFTAKTVIIENVVGAAHDRNGVVETVRANLEKEGYTTAQGIIDCLHIGVPQSRRRLILMASRGALPEIEEIQARYAIATRDLRWAIGDIHQEKPDSVFTAPCISKPETMARINYIFDRDLFDLPNSQRPACHRHGQHTYNSVYGRLRWDKPAQTITGGFYCMCMGRYVHPSQRRTLTAHEAARIQFFPDFFDFSSCRKRTALAKLIGNAVPPKVGYVLARELILSMQKRQSSTRHKESV